MVSLVNLLFIFNHLIIKRQSYYFNSRLLTLFLSLLIFSIISTYYSINITESIISLNKLFIIISTIVCCSICIEKENKVFEILLKILFLSLAFECIFTIVDFFYGSYPFTGVSMNRNISSFSILIKLPLVIYYKDFLKKRDKLYIHFLEILTILSIVLLESRAALFCLIFFYIFYLVYSKSLSSMLKIIFALVLIIFYFPSSTILKNNSIGVENIFTDESLNFRLEFYDYAINFFQNSPIFGNGIGTWKIISSNITSGQVPYYVHNDFLQFLTETGLLGFLCYLAIFIYILFSILKNKGAMSFYLLCAFAIFLIDSLINFPFHRPQEIILFIVIVSTIMKSKKVVGKFQNKLFLPILLILLIISVYVNAKQINASKFENQLLNDLNNSSFTISQEKLNEYDYTFPNLTSNTIPFSSYLARYYLNNEDFENADLLIKYGIDSNPFLSYTQDLKLQSLLMQNKFIKALSVVKPMLRNSRNLELYFDIFFTICLSLNLEKELINIYPLINDLNNELLIVTFFKNYIELQQYDKEIFKDLITKEIINYPDNDDLNQLYNKVK